MSAYNNEQTHRLDVPGHMSGLDVLFSVESDSNIKRAEACSKGLEDVRMSLALFGCFYYDEICRHLVALVRYLFSCGLSFLTNLVCSNFVNL